MADPSSNYGPLPPELTPSASPSGEGKPPAAAGSGHVPFPTAASIVDATPHVAHDDHSTVWAPDDAALRLDAGVKWVAGIAPTGIRENPTETVTTGDVKGASSGTSFDNHALNTALQLAGHRLPDGAVHTDGPATSRPNSLKGLHARLLKLNDGRKNIVRTTTKKIKIKGQPSASITLVKPAGWRKTSFRAALAANPTAAADFAEATVKGLTALREEGGNKEAADHLAKVGPQLLEALVITDTSDADVKSRLDTQLRELNGIADALSTLLKNDHPNLSDKMGSFKESTLFRLDDLRGPTELPEVPEPDFSAAATDYELIPGRGTDYQEMPTPPPHLQQTMELITSLLSGDAGVTTALDQALSGNDPLQRADFKVQNDEGHTLLTALIVNSKGTYNKALAGDLVLAGAEVDIPMPGGEGKTVREVLVEAGVLAGAEKEDRAAPKPYEVQPGYGSLPDPDGYGTLPEDFVDPGAPLPADTTDTGYGDVPELPPGTTDTGYGDVPELPPSSSDTGGASGAGAGTTAIGDDDDIGKGVDDATMRVAGLLDGQQKVLAKLSEGLADGSVTAAELTTVTPSGHTVLTALVSQPYFAPELALELVRHGADLNAIIPDRDGQPAGTVRELLLRRTVATESDLDRTVEDWTEINEEENIKKDRLRGQAGDGIDKKEVADRASVDAVVDFGTTEGRGRAASAMGLTRTDMAEPKKLDAKARANALMFRAVERYTATNDIAEKRVLAKELQYQITHGADINTTNEEGLTPLLVLIKAVDRSDKGVDGFQTKAQVADQGLIRALIKAGADPEAKLPSSGKFGNDATAQVMIDRRGLCGEEYKASAAHYGAAASVARLSASVDTAESVDRLSESVGTAESVDRLSESVGTAESTERRQPLNEQQKRQILDDKASLAEGQYPFNRDDGLGGYSVPGHTTTASAASHAPFHALIGDRMSSEDKVTVGGIGKVKKCYTWKTAPSIDAAVPEGISGAAVRLPKGTKTKNFNKMRQQVQGAVVSKTALRPKDVKDISFAMAGVVIEGTMPFHAGALLNDGGADTEMHCIFQTGLNFGGPSGGGMNLGRQDSLAKETRNLDKKISKFAAKNAAAAVEAAVRNGSDLLVFNVAIGTGAFGGGAQVKQANVDGLCKALKKAHKKGKSLEVAVPNARLTPEQTQQLKEAGIRIVTADKDKYAALCARDGLKVSNTVAADPMTMLGIHGPGLWYESDGSKSDEERAAFLTPCYALGHMPIDIHQAGKKDPTRIAAMSEFMVKA